MDANVPIATAPSFDFVAFVSKFVDANKLGGWVRAGVASALAIAIAKVPVLQALMTPETQTALGVAASGIVVGLWSQLTKSDSAKIAMVEALPDVKHVVVAPTANGGIAAAVADPSRPKVVSATPTP